MMRSVPIEGGSPTLAAILCCAAIWLVACGGSVEPGSGGTSTGAGGSTSSSTSSGSTTTSTTTGDGGGGAAACAGDIEVVVDGGATSHYATACAGSWGSEESSTALGYLFQGGPAPGVKVFVIAGCLGAGPNSEGITLRVDDATTPGAYAKGSTQWVDPDGGAWGVDGDPFDVTISELDAVGGLVQGTFSAMVTHGGNAAHDVAGTFHVCRVSDMNAP